MKKLLITGAGGFLGLAVTKALSQLKSYEIFVTSTGRRSVCFPDEVAVIKTDLLDHVATREVVKSVKPDILLHLAWELSQPGFMRSADNLMWLESSSLLLRTFIECGGEYFAFAGSSAQYPHHVGMSENCCQSSLSLYGQCKSSFNSTARALCGDKSIKYVNLCYFPILGKGMNADTSAAVKAAVTFATNEHFICKAPYNVWDFIDVKDAADATVATLDKHYCGAVNIAAGVPHIMSDVFSTIAKKMDSEHLLSFDFSNTAKEILVADTDILNNVIGYRCKVDFDSTLDGLIRSVRERT